MGASRVIDGRGDLRVMCVFLVRWPIAVVCVFYFFREKVQATSAHKNTTALMVRRLPSQPKATALAGDVLSYTCNVTTVE